MGDPVVELKIDSNPEEYGYIYDRTPNGNDSFIQNSQELNEIVSKAAKVPDKSRAKVLTYDANNPECLAHALPAIVSLCQEAGHKDFIPKGDESFYSYAFDLNLIMQAMGRLFQPNTTLRPVVSKDKTEFTYKQLG